MIILASASPRRRELLSIITPRFEVAISEVDESTDIKDPERIVVELARRKAGAIAAKHLDDLVIGCDTIVFADGEILGKPKDLADAERMIRLLQGRVHTVYTGVAMRRGSRELTDMSATAVMFTAMDDEEIKDYLRTEDVLDKAGAYAIQEGAAKYVRCIDGSFSGVVGMPVEIVYHMLKKMGEPVLETSFWDDGQGVVF